MGCLCGLCYNCVLNCGFGCCEAGNDTDFGSKEMESMLMRGLSMDSPQTFFGTVKNSTDFRVGPKMSMCYLHKICLK